MSQTRITLYMLFLAAFSVLIHHLAGRARIAVWGLFLNRTQPGTECVIGWFATSHLIGIDLRADPTISDLLAQVRTVVLNAMIHQDVSLKLWWDAVGVRKPRSGNRIILDLVTSGRGSSERFDQVSELKSRPVVVPQIKGAIRALHIRVLDTTDELKFLAAYPEDGFVSSSIAGLLEKLQEVTSRFLDGSDQRISDFASICRMED